MVPAATAPPPEYARRVPDPLRAVGARNAVCAARRPASGAGTAQIEVLEAMVEELWAGARRRRVHWRWWR